MYDPSKAKRYTARDGTTFFVNANKLQIQAEDGSVTLKFQRHGSMGRDQTIYLQFSDRSIAISGPDDNNLQTSATVTEGAVPPVQISRVLHGLSRDGDKFESFAQQERLINLTVDMLSNFSTNWVGAAHGEEQNSDVSLSKAFLNDLKSGVYIDA